MSNTELSNAELKKRLRLSSLIILLAGLCGAMLIYLFAEDIPNEPLGSAAVSGSMYPIGTRDCKTYRLEVECAGGKVGLLINDFDHWFRELWHGKALAKTVAWISIFVSLGIYLFSRALRPNVQSDEEGARERDKPN